VIVLVVLFGMPLLFMIVAMIFISANFDKFTEWVDSHMDDSYSISTEQRLSLANIEQAVTNEQARQVGVSRDDCYNLIAISDKIGHKIDSSVCSEDEISVSAEEGSDHEKTISIDVDGTCNSFTFNSTYNYVKSYRSNGGISCKDTVKVKLNGKGRVYENNTEESSVLEG
jgi:hypothetical protein